LVLNANWPKVTKNFLNWSVVQQLWPSVLRAALNTIMYTVISFCIGLILATVFAVMKMSHGPFRVFAVAYIELFRGLPALLTIIIMAFAVPIAFKWRPPGGLIGAGLIALILVTSAYTAEIIRAGIVAVPKGQHEAARSLGMTQMETTVSVILPQAFRIVIPPLTNEFVMLLKDTSLLCIIGSTRLTKELTMFSRDGATTTGNSTPYILVAVFYLIITIPLTYLVARLEKRMAVKK
jgi:polar amino acid transport system permease protein